MRLPSALAVLLAFALVAPTAGPARAASGGSPFSGWDPGAQDCAHHRAPPLEVHAVDARTYILRENLCATWEAPFLYLLIGEKRALLIDTGDVGDPQKMPLADTVFALVHRAGQLPLLVVHTHRHLDHRAGDPQFAHLPDVQLVGYDIDSVKRFYGFSHWPAGQAEIDLGRRIVDVLPTPGHNETHVAFYDRNTALLFSGDFLMPGRLLIDDAKADRASAARMAAFVRNRPVTAVLGGHVEMDANGLLYPWESTFHPDEHTLALTRADVLALPVALAGFNGFYEQNGQFTLLNSLRILEVIAGATLLVLAALAWGIVAFVRRRRARRIFYRSRS